MTRSPARSAAANIASTAEAKCDPKTSAVVVPASTSPVTKSPGHAARVVDVGQPRLLGQRALVEPVEQRHAEPADDAHLREVDVGVDEPGQEHAPRAGRGPPRAGGPARTRRTSPRAQDHAVLVDEQPAVLLGAQGAAGERVGRGVEDRGAEEGHRPQPTAPEPRPAAVRGPRSKVRTRSAATLTAMVAGSLPARSGSPMGVLDPRERLGRRALLPQAACSEPATTWPTTRSGRPSRGARSAARRRTGRRPRRGRGS